MNQEPLLSIVIANYNYGRFIGEAIESVLKQSCQDFELIVCDGGSTDNSVEVIKKYADHIAWWCSEKDGGQSAAFNKGFSHAKGRFLTWLNADDVMLPGTIKKLKVAAEKNPNCPWFVGGVLWLDPDMRVIRCARGRPFSRLRYETGIVSVWGPSSFFTKNLLDSVGGVDERFFYTMDTDLWLKFASKAGERYLPFADYAWGLRMHPDAKMSGHNFSSGSVAYQGGLTGNGRMSDKKRIQLANERQWRCEYFKPKKSSKLRRLMSISWYGAIAGLIDTVVFKGKHYLEVSR